jgi:hypothetical protein
MASEEPAEGMADESAEAKSEEPAETTTAEEPAEEETVMPEDEERLSSPKLTLVHGMSLESTGLDIRDEGNLESISNWSTVPDEDEDEIPQAEEEKEKLDETPENESKDENTDDIFTKDDINSVIAADKFTEDLVEILSQKSLKDEEHTYALEA